MISFEKALDTSIRQVLESLRIEEQRYQTNPNCTWNDFVVLRYQLVGPISGSIAFYIPRIVVFHVASTLLGNVEVFRIDPWVQALLSKTWRMAIQRALDESHLHQVVISEPVFSTCAALELSNREQKRGVFYRLGFLKERVLAELVYTSELADTSTLDE